MLGFTQLMQRDEDLTPIQREQLDMIRDSGTQLLTLINGVLDISNLETGQVTLNPQPFDLWQTVKIIDTMMRSRIEAKGVRLTVTCAPDVPQYITADRQKLQQVLLNLLDNALKFTEEGEIQFSVSREQLSVPQEGLNTEYCLLFTIKDTGIGIAPEDREHLFDVFTQTTDMQKTERSLGLGLPISRQLVQMMGGDIHLESEPDTDTLLIVDDNQANLKVLRGPLVEEGYRVRVATSGTMALSSAQGQPPDLILLDICMPDLTGYEVCERLKSDDTTRDIPVIFLSAVKEPLDKIRGFSVELQDALAEIKDLKDQLHAENVYLREEIKLEHNFEEIIGQSEALKYLLFRIEQVAPTDTAVLICGETGTGKELVARALHHLSPRQDRSLVKVNCAVLPAHLIESELFGHEKGAFTGAATKRVGRFELADGGTIFLDEVGELPLELQPKLLRVLQEGEFQRLGSSRTMKVDIRVIAATNRDLEAEVRAGRFRQDLYYRLNVYPLSVPPLRQRQEDIPLLVQSFVQKRERKDLTNCVWQLMLCVTVTF